MQTIKNLSKVAHRYDVFFLDLWGVVHDGTALYPGVHVALSALKTAGKKVVFISNAPRRSSKVKSVLTQLGIDESLYVDALSSGEVGYRWLAEGRAPWGKKYYFIGATKDADMPVGLDLERVDDIEQANFILNLGFGTEEQTSDDYDALLRAAAKLQMPMLCLNPDLEVVKITGERWPCAGILAKQYEQYGGVVTWFGKPYGDVYDACMALVTLDKSRIIAVGDSLETDIPGGERFGIDTLLITGGILKDLTVGQIEAECRSLKLSPTYIAPNL